MSIYIYIYIYIYILENLKTIAIHVFCVFCAADLCSEDVFRIWNLTSIVLFIFLQYSQFESGEYFGESSTVGKRVTLRIGRLPAQITLMCSTGLWNPTSLSDSWWLLGQVSISTVINFEWLRLPPHQ